MPETYKTFASHLLLKEVSADRLGHLFRAGSFNSAGINRIFWLRVFDHPATPRDDVISAFDRSTRIADSVKSSSVPSGVECVEEDGIPAMATSYVPSQLLSLLIDRAAQERFPVAIDNALLIAEKISAALCAALAVEIDGQRVVHGFLNPSLIFITNDGEAIVTGFGIGEGLLAPADDAEYAAEIEPFLAPEVVETRAPSSSGDVYSLGSILFCLLTGSSLPAAPEDRWRAIVDATVAQEGVPLPNDVRAVLERALAPLPENRFGSAADFKKELDRLLYGGAYSPTTFNLALFVDRLFRSEIEAEEEQIAAVKKIDVGPYLTPVVDPEAIMESRSSGQQHSRSNRALWVGAGVIAAAGIILILWFMVDRGTSVPPPPPTPTAEEIAAQRRAQDEKMRKLAEALVSDLMAEKEEEIRQELAARQEKINELQRRLANGERRATQGQIDIEAQRQRDELQRQIAAEEEAKRQQEADLEAERMQIAEAAQRQAELQRSATPAPDEEREAAAVAPTEPQLTTPPTATATPQPTVVPPPPAIVENDFISPSEVDTLPVIIKESPVAWPRAALHSRRRGVVILQTTVDAKGAVEDLTVLRADHEGFGIPQAVMDAVRKYRFRPATKDGVRVKTHVTVTKAYRFVTR
ncbi:MAG: TonB family protein [Acidobacteriota bacterium]